MKAMAQKSWAAGAPLELTELPDPEPRGHDVRVRVKAIGVNPVDWKMRTRGPLRLAARVVGPPPPIVMGVDFAGVVDAVGAEVKDIKPGDAVVGGTNFSRKQRGSYADTVMVGDDQVCVLPDGFDIDVAGALPVVGCTAWISVVELGRITRGKKVLVLGASGGVGQLCVQVAKHLQGAFVAGVCSTKNVALVKGLGADVVVDYAQGDALTQAAQHAPYDAIIDCVGGYSGSRCRAMLARGGRHVMVASASPLGMLQRLVPPFSSKGVLAVATRERLRPLVDGIAAGKLRVNIAKTFPLVEAEAAHRLSQGGRMTGKILLKP